MPAARRFRKLLRLAPAFVALVAIVNVNVDAKAQTVISTIADSGGPNAVGVNPTTNRVYVANVGDNTVSVVDGSTNAVIGAPIPVGRDTFGVAVNPTANRVYVTNRFDSTVMVIDGSTNAVIGHPIPGGTRTPPSGPLPTPPTDGLPIPRELADLAVNSTTNRVYVANGETDTVSVIDGNTNTLGASIPVGAIPWGVAVNPITNRVYVTNYGSNTVSVIDGNTNAVVGAPIQVGNIPVGVTVNPTTNRVYVANADSNTVSVIDGSTNTVVGAAIPVGKGPVGVALNATTNRVYVANADSNTVSVIDGSTNTVIGAPIRVDANPQAIGVNATTNRVYVANADSNTVSVIDGSTNPPTPVPQTATSVVAQSGPIINDPLTDASLSTSWPERKNQPADPRPRPSGLLSSFYRSDGFHLAITQKSLDPSLPPDDVPSAESTYFGLPNEHLDAALLAGGAGADYTIEVDAARVSGDYNSYYGVVCRMTSTGGYALVVGSGGSAYESGPIAGWTGTRADGSGARAGIWKLVGNGSPGSYTTPGIFQGYLADSDVRPQSVAVFPVASSYHLRADCDGTRLALFVNGVKVAEAQDGEYTSGRVGFYAFTNEASGIDVAFANLSISRPAPVPAAAIVPGSTAVGGAGVSTASELVTLDGVGSNENAGPFPLRGGNYSFNWTGTDPGGDSGGGNLIIDLNEVDQSYSGQSITNVTLESGETLTGATNADKLPAGQYYLRVSAGGVWKVTISTR